MAIKKMPVEEKYDKLYDMYMLGVATDYAFKKGQRTLDRWLDYQLRVSKKMMPRFISPVLLKLLKKLASGKTFKQAFNNMTYARA